MPSTGHPYEPQRPEGSSGSGYSRGPTDGHPQAARYPNAQDYQGSQSPQVKAAPPAPAGFSSGDSGGSKGYIAPPPPPPIAGQPAAAHTSGFGDPGQRSKLWRNAVLALLGAGVLLWLIAWYLPPRMVAFVPTDFDVALGEQNWEELAPPSEHCTDPRPLAYVEELAAPLLAVSNSEFEFQFVVVESEEVNAFALPGGFVTVNMGLLEAAETGEEVAAVLAHEMTHATNRHGMRAVMRRVGAIAVVGIVFGGTGVETLAYAAEGLASQAHSRSQERDADEGGRGLLMDAGVDPTGMATFFERLEEDYAAMPEGMRKGIALLSTHPDPGERADTTRALAQGFEASVDLPDPPEDLSCH